MLAKDRSEILAGEKAAVEGHIGNAPLRFFNQQAGGGFGTALIQVANRCQVGQFFAVMQKSCFPQTALVCHGVDLPRLGKVFQILL